MPDPAVREAARAILADVRARGAAAVRDAAARFGGGRPDGRLLLDPDELAAAADALAAPRSATRSRRRSPTSAGSPRPSGRRRRGRTIVPGVELERRWLPVERVGAYVPGGSAPYPSSLVMTVVPARVAGVGAIVVASPGGRAAATSTPSCSARPGLLGVDALLVAGGVQAIGALAFGLPDEGLPPVDLVVGPGSAWVTAAKVELAGEVGDRPAGRPVRGPRARGRDAPTRRRSPRT